MVFTAWKKSRAPFFLILMHPVTKGCFTVVRSSQTFCISHTPLQIVPCNFYFFLIWNFAFRHKFLPLWKQCFISLSLIEGAYQKSDLLKYLKYCLSTCRQLGRGDNISVIKALFPLWLSNTVFLKTTYNITQLQMSSGHLLLSCAKRAATAKISSFAYLR